jgi:hypothetical protein
MVRIGAAVGFWLFLVSAVLAQEAPRPLAAHQHGHGSLVISISGSLVAVQLEVAAMDIVGFEHDATAPADQAKLTAALANLEQPLALLSPPAGAGCTVTMAKAGLKTQAKDVAEDTSVEGQIKTQPSHADFAARYLLACRNTTALDGLDIGLFKLHPGSQRLTVTTITPAGQSQQDLTPSAPRIALKLN